MRSRRPAHSPVHDVFGHAVRETRARRGLSQEELGFQAKLHRNYVGAIERGEINPTLRVILKLSKGLQVWPSELAELTELRWEAMRNGNDSAEPFGEPQALGRRRRR
jgi:transcriptional regulator with XRE-family HTH domain